MSELKNRVHDILPSLIGDLEDLVRIQSVSADPSRLAEVDKSAQKTAQLLAAEGVEAEIVRAYDGAPPAVIGERKGPAGAPVVLLYAHHDVQPENDPADWDTPPFEPTVRGDRLYGRGAADDKAGIAVHVGALRALGDDLPVTVRFFIEGEEEVSSETLPDLLRQYRDQLAADVIVIADAGNWDIGVPALTTSLRGIMNFFIDVRTLDHAVHSGMFGGAVPDALMALVRLLATMHDDAGDVAIGGLVRNRAAPLDYPVDRFRHEAGILDGVDLIGTGRIVDRLWTRPSLSILGIDAPPTNAAPNALVPAARAKLSMRIAPGDDPRKAFETVKAHVEAHVPWGASAEVSLEHDGDACVIDATGPYYDAARDAFRTAWDGTEPVDIGVGGSIPFIATFQEMFPGASILVTGVEDPHARAHGPNESLHLGEFARVCLAEALLLHNVGQVAR